MSLEEIAEQVQRMANDFVENWNQNNNKYNQNYTLGLFATAWDHIDEIINIETNRLGEYSEIISNILNNLRESKQYSAPIINFPPKENKRKMAAEVSANELKIRDVFTGLIKDDELRKKTRRISTYQEISNEAAHKFIEMYDVLKNNPKYNINEFLELFEISTQTFFRRGNSHKGNYYTLVRGLRREFGRDWLLKFYELLDDKSIADRIKDIENNTGGIKEEDKIRFVEKLIKCGVVGLVEYLDQVSYDYLVAMFGEETFPPEERKIIAEIIAGKIKYGKEETGDGCGEEKDGGLIKGIRYYLGKCQRKKMKDDTVYDWSKNLADKIGKQISISLLNENILVRRRLERNVLEQYAPLFREDADAAFEFLNEEIEDAKKINPVKTELLQNAYNHFELAYKKLRNTKYAKHKIRVIKF